MADDDGDEKTEEPSERKLDKAKSEGQIPMSAEVQHWMILGGGLALTAWMVPPLMTDVIKAVRSLITMPHAIAVDFEHIQAMAFGLFQDITVAMLLPMGMFMVLGVAASVLQNGLSWSSKKIEPKASKISPMTGAKRMFSSRSIVELIKGIIKISLVGVIMILVAEPATETLLALPAMSIPAMMAFMHDLIVDLLTWVVALLTLIAVGDVIYQRFKHTSDMRMSKTEVKDEHKSTEGDPNVKARIRKIRAERARVRMMQEVPKSSVVITNPTHFAVALVYKMDDMQAPKLVAKGVDSLALKIREVAEENDVPIVENPPLARALYAAVDLDREIPQEHYKPVAEVIGYVMRLKGRRSDRLSR